MLFDYKEKYTVLSEAYFGKSNNLKQCEKLLDEMILSLREAHGSSMNINKKMTYNINEDPRLHEVERLLEKQFNLKSFDLTFYIGRKSAYNAWTIPTTIPIFNKDKNMKYGVDSTYFKLNCHVDSMMLILTSITGGELLAIILHEIGHSMDTSIFYILSNLTLDIRQLIPGLILSLPPIRQFIGKIQTTIDKLSTTIFDTVPLIKPIFIGYTNIVLSLKIFYYNFANIPIILSNPQIYLNALSPDNIFGYGNEKFADSFAAAHGYGKELISGLDKLENKEGLVIGNAIQHCGLIAIPYDLASVFTNIALAPLDPHPATPIRMRSIIKKLERDLDDPNIDPKLKKELKEQIKEVSRFIDEEYTTIYTDVNKNRIIKVLYTKLMMTLPFDIREIPQLIKPREI